MTSIDHVEVYEDASGRWRWRRRAANGEIVADSGQGHEDRHYCAEAAVRYNAGVALRLVTRLAEPEDTETAEADD